MGGGPCGGASRTTSESVFAISGSGGEKFILGSPAFVSRVGEEDTWTYAYYKGGGIRNWLGANPAIGQQQKRLVVTFKGDSVKEATFRQELPLPDPLEAAYR